MQNITTNDINQEIHAILDILVEDGKCRMTQDTRFKIRQMIKEEKYEFAINEMGGNAFLDVLGDPDLDALGELFCMGFLVREGFQGVKIIAI